MAIRLSNAPAAAAVNAIVDRLDAGGYLRIYTGSQPAIGGTPAGTLLASLTLSAPAFGAASASGGVVTSTAETITQDSSADATGTAGCFALFASDGTTVEASGTVTATGGGGDITLVTTSIVAAQPVQVTSFAFTFDQDLGA